ncbi:penicillin-binding transpeptidase domain-containing protein [Streptosporangium sp. NPDC023963]|uniref:penicillin-binding transpeptidase domain-containing protein n=1 Tax=Streptosporangium sp. NPDC023963 TaxID=3155608 RepID=UPI00343FF70B
MRGRARRTAAAALALVATAPMLSACFEEPSAHEAVRDFLIGWQTGDYAAAARRTDGDQKVVSRALEDAKLQLDAASFRFNVKSMRRAADEVEADFDAEVDLGENNPLWEYEGKLPLHLVDGQWRVRWSPSVLHPQLREGERFAVKVTPEGRQPILDRNGDPLQEKAVLHVASVVPSNLKGGEADELCEKLSKMTGFPQDRLLSRIRSAPPNLQVPLVTFSRTKFRQLQGQLEAIPGITLSAQDQAVAPASPTQIVGTVTAVTAESEQQLGGPQRAGDTVGRGGLQRAYQEHLTGSTDTRVITVDLKTLKVTELKKWRPDRATSPVRTTLDRSHQKAADGALLGGTPGMLVAVQASTGDILAVSSTEQYNDQDRPALAGRFPAGTAFSIMTVEGMLRAKIDPKQKVACPADRSVGGAAFHQEGGPAGGSPTLQTSFATGCVTALASLARRINGSELAADAAKFGIGVPWSLPLKSFSGSVNSRKPLKNDAATAKAITGQNVRVSPLSMALVAGAVASGTWRPPVLVTEPKTADPTTDTKPTKVPDPVKLDDKTVETLRAFMRSGVTGGSARAAAAPGDPVHGITASVMQNRKPLSWFVGWQGDVAVAVLTQSPDAAAGATVAGRFFQGLHAGL